MRPASDARPVDEVFGSQRPADMRLITHKGSAAHVLLMYSQGAVMVVVGSGRHHATCPVAVVPMNNT